MWKTGVHWLMEEGVECVVELVNGNKDVVVITKGEEDFEDNCNSVFGKIVSCVMEAKAEFCHPIKPQFFLLGSTESEDYLNKDNLFYMSEVAKALHSTKGDKVIILTKTGKRRMKRVHGDYLLA